VRRRDVKPSGPAQYDAHMASRWDEFIDWEKRAEAEEGFFTDLLHDHGVSKVIDVASGTGYHTVALAEAGFDVVASDGSPAMVEQTKRACEEHGLDVEVWEADWRTLREQVPGTYDALICLGNSFTHLATPDRPPALEQFRAMLRRFGPGLVVLDMRNYDRILTLGYSFAHRVYYRGESVGGGPVELTEERVRFRYQFADGSLGELEVYPVRQAELKGLFAQTGFTEVDMFGDFENPFDTLAPDFVIAAAYGLDMQERGRDGRPDQLT
jgi:SAM-dependent methyltransferase